MHMFKEALQELSQETYIAIKNQAYQAYEEFGPMDLKGITAYVKDLGYPLDSIEGNLLSSTLLFPFDAKICDDYQACCRDSSRLKNLYLAGFASILERKVAEIELQKLDLLLGQELLIAPNFGENTILSFRKS